MSACEHCWTEASRRALLTGRPTEVYQELIEANPDACLINPDAETDRGDRCACGHFLGSHGNHGCTIEIGDSGSGSVADAVFCRCTELSR